MPFLAPIGAAVLGALGTAGPVTLGAATAAGAATVGVGAAAGTAAGFAIAGAANDAKKKENSYRDQMAKLTKDQQEAQEKIANAPQVAAESAKAASDRIRRARQLSGGKTLLTSDSPILTGGGKTLLGS